MNSEYYTNNFPESFGFRSGDRGTITTRTIMVPELSTILDLLPAAADKSERWAAIIEDNILWESGPRRHVDLQHSD